MEARKEKEPFHCYEPEEAGREGKKAPMGLIFTVMFYKTDFPALSREGRRRGKE